MGNGFIKKAQGYATVTFKSKSVLILRKCAYKNGLMECVSHGYGIVPLNLM